MKALSEEEPDFKGSLTQSKRWVKGDLGKTKIR
jgi:hypothetical protein